MARLTVSALGALEIALDGQPVAALATSRARTLKIEDQDLRRSYLENVPYHREMMAEYARTNRGESDDQLP